MNQCFSIVAAVAVLVFRPFWSDLDVIYPTIGVGQCSHCILFTQGIQLELAVLIG